MSEKKEQLAFEVSGEDNKSFDEMKDAKAVKYLSVLDTQSKACKKGTSKYVEGAEPGKYFVSGNNEVLGDSVDVIVLDFFRYFLEAKPNQGGVVGRHNPAAAMQLIVNHGDFGRWKTARGHDMIENYGYAVQIVGKEALGTVIFSLKSTGIKIAQAWNDVMDQQFLPSGIKAQPHHQIYTLKAKVQSKGDFSWWSHDVKFKSLLVSQEQYDNVLAEQKKLPSHDERSQIEAPTEKPAIEGQSTEVQY